MFYDRKINFLKFHYPQTLKFLYPFLYMIIVFLCFIMFRFFQSNQNFALIYDLIFAIHCVKSVRIRSYSGSHFSRIFRIQTEYGEILLISPCSVRMRENAGKMRTRITPNMDIFYAVNSVNNTAIIKIFNV